MSLFSHFDFKEGRTVLHWICALGDLEKAKYVLSVSGVDVNLQDNAGWTPLMISVSSGKEDIVERLLEIEAIDVLVQNASGATALYHPSISF
jgi:ankyrin repeat protein